MKKVLLIVPIFFFLTSYVFGYQQENNGCFNILTQDDTSILAACIKSYKYDENTLGAFFLENFTGDYHSTPEHLIAKEFDFHKKGDLENTLKLHRDEDNHKETKSFYADQDVIDFIKKWEDVKFISKFQWGPFVRVRENLVNGEKYFKGIHYLKKSLDGYDFNDDVHSSHIFSYVCSVHPWNINVLGDYDDVKIDNLEKIIIRYSGEEGTADYFRWEETERLDGDIVVAAKIDKFLNGGYELLGGSREEIPEAHSKLISFIDNVLKVSKTGTDQDFVNLWEDIHRVRFNSKKELLSQFKNGFSRVENMLLLSVIKSDQGNVLYYKPKVNGIYQKIEELIYVDNGSLYLSKIKGKDGFLSGSIKNLIKASGLKEMLNN